MNRKGPLYKTLYFQVVCAIAIGVALGHFYPSLGMASFYLTMAAIFIAQAVGLDLTLKEESTLLGVLLLTSKGVPVSQALDL